MIHELSQEDSKGEKDEPSKRASRLPISAYRLPAGIHGLPRQYVAENQRWRLAAAAAELLAEIGLQRLTMRAIASRAAVARAVLYREFRDPAAALAEAFRLSAAEIRARVESSCEAAGTGDMAVSGLEAIAGSIAADSEVRALLGWEAAVASAEIASDRLHLLDEFALCLIRASGVNSRPRFERTRLCVEGGLALLVSESHHGQVVARDDLVLLVGSLTV
jgi:AcrR family transcriptional regulator